MKNVCLLYLLLIGLSACGGKKTDSISLSGEIKGLGNDTIYLYGEDRMHDRMDTLIAEKDKFSATLSADTLVTTILLFSDGTEYPLFPNKGNKIQIKGSMAELSSLQISGNAPNKELTDFNQELKGLGTPSEKALEEKAENFITEHPASLASIYLLDKYFVQNPQPDLTQIQKLADRMTGELKDRPFMDALLKRIEEEEKVAVGKSAPYFRLRNAEEKDISRSTLKISTCSYSSGLRGIRSAVQTMPCSAVFIRKSRRIRTSHCWAFLSILIKRNGRKPSKRIR